MHYYSAKDFNSEFKINLIMILICLTSFKQRSRYQQSIEMNMDYVPLYKRLNFMHDDRMFYDMGEFEQFILKQEISSLISNGLIFTKEKTSTVSEAAMNSMKYIIRLWESKANVRKLY